MVLLAAAVCTKIGKPLVSRQFVEMSRARIEGLLAAFPKLMGSDSKAGSQKQHTFVETDSVRYVYQPMESLYMLLITTKTSNILEDLETLRLFSRVVAEYCQTVDEKEVVENAFNLIFAFDEIVALGYRENVNLAQIRTFTEMESHEEKVYLELKKSQEREAKDKAKEKARELAAARKEAHKRGMGRPPAGIHGGGYGPGSGMGGGPDSTADSSAGGPRADTGFGDGTSAGGFKKTTALKPSGPTKAMRLGGKHKDVDSFVDQLKQEGQEVISPVTNKHTGKQIAAPTSNPGVKTEAVHIRIEEKANLTVSRDGGLVEPLEIQGMVQLRISAEQFQRVKIKIENSDKHGAQLQTHPNLDKKIFGAEQMLCLKNPAKPFPLNTDIGVLKWRFQTTDETKVPLSVNCWPSESGKGCDVNMEYTLEMEDLELVDVVFSIPLPTSVVPVITECHGDYKHERGKGVLEWRLPVIDKANKTGSLEFSTSSGVPDNFFPVKVHFTSRNQYCQIMPVEAFFVDSGDAVKFSVESTLYTEQYEIQ